jgi:predicted 3-demethylubiquinone-9 3-methyltransferase (glyoxalase superfamily)
MTVSESTQSARETVPAPAEKITPFLWFDKEAEEAANYYVSIFKNSKLLSVTRYGDAGPGTPGSVMTATFQLEDQVFTGVNAGPHFKFTEAVSFVIHCKSQDEVDYYWQKLTADGGQESQCGWLKDKYGMSWQVTPDALLEMIKDSDREKSQRVMQAMLQMKKIDIGKLREAYDNA